MSKKMSVAEYNKKLETVRTAKHDLVVAEISFVEAQDARTQENCCECKGLSRFKMEKCSNCNGKGYV